MTTLNPLYMEDLSMIGKLSNVWADIDNSSILITGGTGLIGICIAEAILFHNRCFNSKIQVSILTRDYLKARMRLGAFIDDPLLKIIQGNICVEMPDTIDCDFILHLASNTHPRAYAADPVGTIETNILGTQNTLKLAVKRKTKRVLFASSVEIYGDNRGDVVSFDEQYCGYIDCNTLRAGYTEGKRAGEALCQAYIEKFGIDVVIPRLSRVYGPTMLSSDSKASAQFIRKAINHEDIVLKSEGNQHYSYCYGADAASALLFLLVKGKCGNAYNVAGLKSDIRLKEFALLAAQTVGKTVVFELPDAEENKGFSKVSTALLNIEKIEKLGWYPQIDIVHGIERTINILRDAERGFINANIKG